jgi:hypothetical protein
MENGNPRAHAGAPAAAGVPMTAEVRGPRLRAALIAFGAGVALPGWLALMIFTTDRALPRHFPRGVEACFGRIYDAAFLTAHPNHRVSELYIYRDFSTGAPRGDSRPPAMQIAADRASPDDLSVTVMARFRNMPGAYDRSVSCDSDGPAGASCRADCEGANFSVYPEGRGLVLERSSSNSFVHLNGGGPQSTSSVTLRLKADDANYRLEPMPIADCLAAYDHPAQSD